MPNRNQLPLFPDLMASQDTSAISAEPDPDTPQVKQTLASLRRLQAADPLAFTAYSQQVLNRLRAATRDFERELRLS